MRFYGTIFAILLLAGCAGIVPPEPAARQVAVSWEALPGWKEDRHAAAVPVFLRSCQKLEDAWSAACAAAAQLPANTDDNSARRFFEEHFAPRKLQNESGGDTGLITGYYEPLLNGSLSPSSRFKYPVYGKPPDLLAIDIVSLHPDLKGKRLRGRVQDSKVIPYYSRAEIDGVQAPLAGEELLWVDDKTALFFLHIQGSGLVELQDGSIVGVGYRDQNGHPYRSIGRILAERGDMKIADINLFSLRAWLKNNARRADELLNTNPSYIFFTRRDEIDIGPAGALGVPLTPERSLAVDNNAVPAGAPVWLSTVRPDDDSTPLERLMVAQDIGGAIKGDIRADFFWGRGNHAEKMAGLMKTRGRLFVLYPK